MKSVVVGVDGSTGALCAVRWAATEAVTRRRPLRILHCSLLVHTTRFPAHAQAEILQQLTHRSDAVLEAAAAEARSVVDELDVTTTTSTELAIPGLLAAADGAELLVLGARGIGAFEQLLLGSTSRAVVAHATVPVVVVRGESGGDHKRIAVGVDGSDVSMRAVEFAFMEASWRDAVLVAVHACGFPRDLHDLSEPVREQLRALDIDDRLAVQETLAGQREEHPDVKVEEVFVHDEPVAALVAQSRTADLVVVGSRGRGATVSLLLGSVAHALLRHAATPVAVVHD